WLATPTKQPARFQSTAWPGHPPGVQSRRRHCLPPMDPLDTASCASAQSAPTSDSEPNRGESASDSRGEGLSLPRCNLVVDPRVRPLEAVDQRYRRLPPELLTDQLVVAVASTDALWRVQLVVAFKFDARDLLDNRD